MDTFAVALTCIALLVCVLTVIFFLKPVQDLLKAKLNKTQLDTLTDFTKSCVGYAKQWLTSNTGAEKKMIVSDMVINKAFELGIEITQKDIDVLIESAYEKIKDR